MACTTALTTLHPHLYKSFKAKSGRLELVATICICAKQTFIQAAAQEEAFATAFTVALDAYSGSTLQKDVNQEIAGLLPQDYEPGPDSPKWQITTSLVNIIIAHPLDIPPEAIEQNSS